MQEGALGFWRTDLVRQKRPRENVRYPGEELENHLWKTHGERKPDPMRMGRAEVQESHNLYQVWYVLGSSEILCYALYEGLMIAVQLVDRLLSGSVPLLVMI